ncbi:MAG: 50S ribosomal protein L19e [Candidatus Lokiarchaeota archaeon]|nr:50S ribosomal protein L19e [Candidatus Lokiarchaeota archaeon]
MVNVSAQKRIASEVLNCGVNRIWIDPVFIDEVLMAITREDIRNLIKEGIIQKRQKKGISKSKTNIRKERKRKGRARGLGKRKGKSSARNPPKKQWINKIRAQRRKLKELRDNKVIDRSTYRKMYLRAKGGSFKSVAGMERFMKDNKMLKKRR